MSFNKVEFNRVFRDLQDEFGFDFVKTDGGDVERNPTSLTNYSNEKDRVEFDNANSYLVISWRKGGRSIAATDNPHDFKLNSMFKIYYSFDDVLLAGVGVLNKLKEVTDALGSTFIGDKFYILASSDIGKPIILMRKESLSDFAGAVQIHHFNLYLTRNILLGYSTSTNKGVDNSYFLLNGELDDLPNWSGIPVV